MEKSVIRSRKTTIWPDVQPEISDGEGLKEELEEFRACQESARA